MTLPTSTSVANLSREYIVPAWYPTGFVDQFIRKIPFQRLDQPGETVEWNRGSATALVVSPYDAGTTLPQLPLTAARQAVGLRRIGDVTQVDYFQETASSNTVDIVETAVQAKKVGVVRTLGSQIFSGDGTGANLEGLDIRIGTSQELAAATPTIEDVHKLIYMVRASDGCVGAGADCLVAVERVVRFVLRLLEQTPGGAPQYAFDAQLGVPVPLVQGIPLYVGQVTETGENPDSSLWALKLHGPTGIRVLHTGGVSTDYGIEVVDVPMQATASFYGKFVGGMYGILVPEEESFARIVGINVGTLPVPA